MYSIYTRACLRDYNQHLTEKMMKFINTKLLGAAAVALMFAAPNMAQAQVETIQADLVTDSAITTTNVSNMDFGEWFLVHGGVGTGVITLTDDGSVSATATTTPAGSTFTNITPPATEGVITVSIPAATVMTMTRSNTTDFADTGLSLAAVTYRTATENGNIDNDGDAEPVTVTVANTPETVTFGGQVAITDTPADAAHSATFDVTFSF